MKRSNKWTIFIFVLILITISTFMATIVQNNYNNLSSEIDYNNIKSSLSENINIKWLFSIKHDIYQNNNWGWFIDNIWCPDSVTMSWNTLRTTWINTFLSNEDGNIFCSWSYNSNNFNILFNDEYTSLIYSNYINGTNIGLTNWNWIFSDVDNTNINFNTPVVSDNYDDNMNSDDYTVYSTWNISYNYWYQDDDTQARKTIHWYLKNSEKDYNIFWNNEKYNNYIDSNSNNDDNLNIKLSNVDYWYLYFDVGKNFDLKILEFDRDIFNETNNLTLLNTYKTNWILSGSWYLQLNWDNLSLSAIKTWSEFNFNFKDNDYWFFLTNNTTDILLYNIYWESDDWKSIYINAIDDSNGSIIKVLSNHIIIKYNDYYHDQFEIFWIK